MNPSSATPFTRRVFLRALVHGTAAGLLLLSSFFALRTIAQEKTGAASPKQRAFPLGHIPAGARLKAFQHMQRMMEAEGKLVRRPDGSFAAVTPEAGTA